jgi:hypothetical protein
VAGIAVTHLFIYHATRASAERGWLIAQLEQALRVRYVVGRLRYAR